MTTPACSCLPSEVWQTGNAALQTLGRTFTNPQEKLLAGLGYAARLFEPLRRSLQTETPTVAMLTTEEAYAFLRTAAPVLEESGFGVLVPPWWNKPGARLGVRLRMNAAKGATPDLVAGGRMSLDKLVDYRWEVALGEASLSRAEFDALVALKSPLVQVRGQWVQLDPDQVEAAIKFWQRLEAGGTLSLADAVQLGLERRAHRGAGRARGDVRRLAGRMDGAAHRRREADGAAPAGQPARAAAPLPAVRLFLARLLAPLAAWAPAWPTTWAWARRSRRWPCCCASRKTRGRCPGPVLLVAPTSVVTNWEREAETFAPGLRVLVHQGAQRLRDEALLAEVGAQRRGAEQLCRRAARCQAP